MQPQRRPENHKAKRFSRFALSLAAAVIFTACTTAPRPPPAVFPHPAAPPAARDAAGHQFSFIFFASAETARKIYAEISRDDSLKLSRSSGRILEVVYDDPTTVSRPAISDTSDPNWSAPLRQAWPYYLMGASQMWLDLISEMADGAQETETASTFGDLDHRYAGINAAITTLWQNEGRHAFLHHLNALFGYEPIVIVEKRHMRF